MPELEKVVELSDEARLELIRSKATCPFIGSAIAAGILPVRNNAENPLASIEDVRALGNQHQGSLGDVLAMFAAGNHAFMRDGAGQLLSPVPDGLFSLDFPDSQGSHPGDSGILQGDPKRRGPDKFGEMDFARLESRAQDGRLTRPAIGDFIAENVRRDPNARIIGRDVIERRVNDLFALFEEVIPAAIEKLAGQSEEANAAHRRATQRLTKLLAEDNIAGSSGEFGLLFALLSTTDEAEPVLHLDELRMMFQEKRLPAGWDQARKTGIEWVKHTLAILVSAYESYAKRTGDV